MSSYITARKKAKFKQVANHPERPQIVSYVPIPVEKRGGIRKFDHFYPFEDMKPGDSFWVPAQSYCTAGAITRFSKKTGWKFCSRAQGECGTPNSKIQNKKLRGTRVWRIA